MKIKFFNPSIDEKSDLFLCGCGYEQCENNFVSGPKIRKMFIIHYVIKGKGYYTVRNKEYSLSAGDVFVIFPEDVVYYRADSDDPWLFCWITFGGEKANLCYNMLGIDHEHIIVHNVDEKFIQSVTNCLEYTSEYVNNISQFRLTSCILECLSTIENSQSASKNTVLHKRIYVNSAISFMEYNYNENISISEIAKHVGLERSYFYRIFTNETKITPKRYLMNLRIDKAKKLIKQGVQFKEIAPAIGLKDVYQFTNLFIKITGTTPSKYRLLNIKEIDSN